MGRSLVFLFLTWHIPSVAGAMTGAVHLPLADVYYPTMLAWRAGAAGLATAGTLFALGRSGHDRLREWSALHTRGNGGAGGSGGLGGSTAAPGGAPHGPGAESAAGTSSARTTAGSGAVADATVAPAREPAPGGPPQSNVRGGDQ
jgi:hypothetical protein